VAELAAKLSQSDPAISMVFVSSQYDLEVLGRELARSLPGPVIGCSTSGEITPCGYANGALSGFSIASPELATHTAVISPLRGLAPGRVEAVIESAQSHLEAAQQRDRKARAFGVLLIDGLSVMEEQVIAILAEGLGEIPIVGGSAGDDLRFESTHVFTGERFVPDAAVFTLFVTTLPFAPIKTQHFSASDQRLVITRAAPERRIVYEINGHPAAEEYARLIGAEQTALGPETYSNYPLMLRFGGEYFVRSIQKANPDGSLTFYCAIDEGVVLRLAHGENLIENLRAALAATRAQLGSVRLTLGFDCILRRLEVASKGIEPEVNRILMDNHVIGFSTYGEQYRSVHVNQTFTGVALGG
jgi:hypothetical protein